MGYKGVNITRTCFPDEKLIILPYTHVFFFYILGAMAGIGFGMLIVGLVLAVVLYIVVNKVRGKPLDNMTISFVKQEADS